MYGIGGILKGMSVTMKNFLRKPVTVRYPEEDPNQPMRFRGYNFSWFPDRCTVCRSCAKACPHGVIIIQTGMHEGQRTAERFEIDTGLCIACGLCVEACPFTALFMGRSFEMASYSRAGQLHRKERLANNDRSQMSAFAFEGKLKGIVDNVDLVATAKAAELRNGPMEDQGEVTSEERGGQGSKHPWGGSEGWHR
jgi:NADH-quinone oxidoreductase subunit I